MISWVRSFFESQLVDHRCSSPKCSLVMQCFLDVIVTRSFTLGAAVAFCFMVVVDVVLIWTGVHRLSRSATLAFSPRRDAAHRERVDQDKIVRCILHGNRLHSPHPDVN